MTIVYTPALPAVAYDFLRGKADMLSGTMPTYLTAAYRKVNVALVTGSISIKIADTGSQFQLQCTLNDSELGVDADTTSDEKFDELKLLEGTIGTLVKDGRTCTSVEFQKITLSSRRISSTTYPIDASISYTTLATITFEKLDA